MPFYIYNVPPCLLVPLYVKVFRTGSYQRDYFEDNWGVACTDKHSEVSRNIT